MKGRGVIADGTETPYIMKLNAQQRFERLNLYGLVQGLSYVVRLNDLKTAQHLRARLALVLRHPGGLAKPLHAELKELFATSGVWVRDVGDRHQTRRNIQGIIRRIIPRLKRPLARGKLAPASLNENLVDPSATTQKTIGRAPCSLASIPRTHRRTNRR